MHRIRTVIIVVAGLACIVNALQAADPPSKPFQYGTLDFRHTRQILDAVLSPDAKLLATVCSRDVMVWDIETGKRLHYFFDCGVPPYSLAVNIGRVAFSPDNHLLAHSVQTDVAARVWDLKTGRELRSYGTNLPSTAPTWRRTWVEFTPDGTNISVIRLHDIEHFAVEGGKLSQKLSYSERSFDLLAMTPGGRDDCR